MNLDIFAVRRTVDCSEMNNGRNAFVRLVPQQVTIYCRNQSPATAEYLFAPVYCNSHRHAGDMSVFDAAVCRQLPGSQARTVGQGYPSVG